MNPYLMLTTLFGLAVLQSTVMPRIHILGVHPDLMLMVVTSWSLLRGSEEGMLWALIGGAIVDLFSAAPFGVCTLSLLIVSFLSGLGERHIFRFDLLIPILVIPVVSLVYGGLTLVLLRVLGWTAGWRDSLTQVLLPFSLVNTLLMPLVYLIMRTLYRRTARKETSW
ncbi:MAG: rod shape-determining protein MreD [Anaerolineae bacterium]|nr:rod shape-determining protein MreD [Anaerolineae bacterium]